jgi:hypothetical protein
LKLAHECFGDGDVVQFLRERGVPVEPLHSYSQGNVVRDVLARKAAVGMVDEDPMSTHHRARDRMVVVHRGQDVDLLKETGRYLLVLKPDLEGCFFAAARRLAVSPSIAKSTSELHRLLGKPQGRQHEQFRAELTLIHAAAQERKMPSFTLELETLLGTILPPKA